MIAALLLLWQQPVAPTAVEWQKLGLTHHLRNQYEPAMEAFQRAIKLDPLLWTSHLFLGIGRYRTNQFAPALESLAAAGRFAPATAEGRDEIDFWLGATRIALKKPLAGLKDLERFLIRNPNHADALQLAGRTYADLSSALWNGVAEKHFETPPGWEVHGHALESDGNFPGALDAYRQAKKLNPKRQGPGLAIGRLLLNQGNAEEAFAVLSEELAIAPGHPETSHYAGLAAVQLQRYPEAARLLEPASRWFADAALALTQVYLALRDPGKASAAAARAVQAEPDSEAAHELLVTALLEAGLSADAENERWRKVR